MPKKERFRSLTGGEHTEVFPDEPIQVATPQGLATQFHPRGRVTIKPEGTSVSPAHAQLLKEHARYGEAFISEEDIQKRLAAAGAKNPQAAKEDELRARIAELEAQLKDAPKQDAADVEPETEEESPFEGEPTEAKEAAIQEADAEEEPVDEQPAEEPAEAPSEDLRPIESVDTVNKAIAYLVRYQKATKEAIDAAGGVHEYAATEGVSFPNLEA